MDQVAAIHTRPGLILNPSPPAPGPTPIKSESPVEKDFHRLPDVGVGDSGCWPLSPYLPCACNDVFVGSQFAEADGAAGVELLR